MTGNLRAAPPLPPAREPSEAMVEDALDKLFGIGNWDQEHRVAYKKGALEAALPTPTADDAGRVELPIGHPLNLRPSRAALEEIAERERREAVGYQHVNDIPLGSTLADDAGAREWKCPPRTDWTQADGTKPDLTCSWCKNRVPITVYGLCAECRHELPACETISPEGYAPCPVCHQYSHSIGGDKLAEAFNHFQSMFSHRGDGIPTQHSFDEQTRDAAQALMTAARALAKPVPAEVADTFPLMRALALFRSVILSGERWSPECQQAFDNASALITRLARGQTYGEGIEAAENIGQLEYHSSEEDGGPDVGFLLTVANGKHLWCGEITRREADEAGVSDRRWHLVFHDGERRLIFGQVTDEYCAREAMEGLSAAIRALAKQGD